MHEILPGLWLGNLEDARSFSMTMDVVVNCTVDLPFFGGYQRMRVPVDDNLSENETLAPHLNRVVEIVLGYVERRKRVLVHCFAGIQRSAAVVAAIVMRDRGLDVQGAVEFVRARRPDAFSGGVNFMPSLRIYEIGLSLK